jgi:hypothetical protein
MWQAIQTTRGTGPRVVYGGASHVAGTSEKRFGSKVWWAAAAAVVLVASGIGIGRWTASPNVAPANTASARRPASPQQGTISEPTGKAQSATAPSVGGESMVANAPNQNAGRAPLEGRAPSSGSAASLGSAPSSAYQLAAVNHLSDAEALLVSFRTRATADQQLDAQLAAWARELLTNTRLLLDSPVAADQQRRPLLEDLELLLVQIVQLSPASTPQDREIIEQTLKQDQVLTRLRTAIPAGQRGS